MDREEAHKAIRLEKDTLQQSLMDDAGTPEQTTQWLARLEEIDPEHFEDFDSEYQDHLTVTKRAHELSAKLSSPIASAELEDLVRAIRAYQAKSEAGDDLYWDYQAQYYLLDQANPDADWATLISEAHDEMAAEDVVDLGLAQKRRVFAMPGPIDEHWNQDQDTPSG